MNVNGKTVSVETVQGMYLGWRVRRMVECVFKYKISDILQEIL
jgi:hypothetical protein